MRFPVIEALGLKDAYRLSPELPNELKSPARKAHNETSTKNIAPEKAEIEEDVENKEQKEDGCGC